MSVPQCTSAQPWDDPAYKPCCPVQCWAQYEEKRIAVLADFKDLADVGMIERGHRHRLPPQALARTRISCGFGRQQLDGDSTIETRVVGNIDFAHGSRADGGQNFVGTEARARCQT
jgi:hypothetical protein